MMKKPLALAAAVLAADQASKFLIDNFVPYASSIPIIKPFHFFNIVNFRNTGIAFSAFQNKNIVFIFLVFGFLAFFAFWLYKNAKKITHLQRYAFCLVLAGGLGNLTDRIFRGWVIDFLDFGINNLRWPAFNVADSAVCIAMGLILLTLIRDKKK